MQATSTYVNGQQKLSICLPPPSRTYIRLAGHRRLKSGLTLMAALSLQLTITTSILAQSFTLDTNAPFQGVSFGSTAFADIDNDKDEDVLITGIGTSRLYRNDGSGTFTLDATTVFDEVLESSIAFADVDDDKDQDVLITGYNRLSGAIAKLYRNDGKGRFTLDAAAPFEGVFESSIAFADVDDDKDQDVLITGNNGLGSTAKLYRNDGSGKFTLDTDTPFKGVHFSSIAFADVDKDKDEDVLITGYNYLTGATAELYRNDGKGTFTLDATTVFDEVFESSIAFADVDNDKDQDVLITGNNGLTGAIAKLYRNDGKGRFTIDAGTPFEGVLQSSIAFADVDDDKDDDVLISGYNLLSGATARLYRNDGEGRFTLDTSTPFEGVFESSIAFADVDKDKDMDVLITGSGTASLYRYDGKGKGSRNARPGANTSEPLQVRVYPNPVVETLDVEVQGLSVPARLALYDINGQLQEQWRAAPIDGVGTLKANVGALAEGLYILSVETSEGVIHRQRVLKQR